MVRPHGLFAVMGRVKRRGQRGASAVEYALVAVLIAVVIIGAVTLLGGKTSSLFQRTCDSIPSAGSTC